MVLTANEVESTRGKRFLALRAHFEAEGPDVTVLGASKDGRWAVLTESQRGHGKFLNRAPTREQAEEVAGANIHEGWDAVALFDLDELAGDPPVMVTAEFGSYTWDVIREQREDGELTGLMVLRKAAANGRFYDWETVHPDDLSNVEWSEDDRRLPVRYDVAGIMRVVAFNTIASA
jgi:hypothetical protein